MGLKCTGMSCLEKILLSFSEIQAIYGITICLHLFLASLPVWFGPFVFADLTRPSLGIHRFEELYWSADLPFVSLSLGKYSLSARWCSVLMTASVCSSG